MYTVLLSGGAQDGKAYNGWSSNRELQPSWSPVEDSCKTVACNASISTEAKNQGILGCWRGKAV